MISIIDAEKYKKTAFKPTESRLASFILCHVVYYCGGRMPNLFLISFIRYICAYKCSLSMIL